MELHLRDCEPESHYAKHLCALADRKQILTLARLARNAKYICAICGRVAAKAEHGCAPTLLADELS